MLTALFYIHEHTDGQNSASAALIDRGDSNAIHPTHRTGPIMLSRSPDHRWLRGSDLFGFEGLYAVYIKGGVTALTTLRIACK